MSSICRELRVHVRCCARTRFGGHNLNSESMFLCAWFKHLKTNKSQMRNRNHNKPNSCFNVKKMTSTKLACIANSYNMCHLEKYSAGKSHMVPLATHDIHHKWSKAALVLSCMSRKMYSHSVHTHPEYVSSSSPHHRAAMHGSKL